MKYKYRYTRKEIVSFMYSNILSDNDIDLRKEIKCLLYKKEPKKCDHSNWGGDFGLCPDCRDIPKPNKLNILGFCDRCHNEGHLNEGFLCGKCSTPSEPIKLGEIKKLWVEGNDDEINKILLAKKLNQLIDWSHKVNKILENDRKKVS